MNKQFTEEFRREAVRQIEENGHPVAEVSERLGVSTHSLYQWIYANRNAARADVFDFIELFYNVKKLPWAHWRCVATRIRGRLFF